MRTMFDGLGTRIVVKVDGDRITIESVATGWRASRRASPDLPPHVIAS